MNQNKFNRLILVLGMVSGVTAGCGDDESGGTVPDFVDQTTPGTIANFLARDPRFSVFVELANRTGQFDALDSDQTVTLFAPTDAAFNALPDDFLVSQNFVTNGDPELLNTSLSVEGIGTLLQAHTVAGEVSSEALIQQSTLGAFSVSVEVVDPDSEAEGDEFVVLDGRAQVISADQSFSNGVIHVIDSVIVPAAALAAEGELDSDVFPGSLTDLVDATPLYQPYFEALRGEELLAVSAITSTTACGGVLAETILIPADGVPLREEGELPDGINPAEHRQTLLQHVVCENYSLDVIEDLRSVETSTGTTLTVENAGGIVTVGGPRVVSGDIRAQNGVIHLIEGLITLPSATSEVPPAEDAE